jgi:hypothetical protein
VEGEGHRAQGGSRRRAEHDYFSRHPHRLARALLDGAISWHAFCVISFLIDRIDHGRTPRPLSVQSLAHLRKMMRFSPGERTLRRALNEARDGGWIEFETPTGSRRSYTFELGRAAIDAVPPDRGDPALPAEAVEPSAGHAGVQSEAPDGQKSVQPDRTAATDERAENSLPERAAADLSAGHAAPAREEEQENRKSGFPLRSNPPRERSVRAAPARSSNEPEVHADVSVRLPPQETIGAEKTPAILSQRLAAEAALGADSARELRHPLSRKFQTGAMDEATYESQLARVTAAEAELLQIVEAQKR